jgi:hypothetical protein
MIGRAVLVICMANGLHKLRAFFTLSLDNRKNLLMRAESA